MKKNKSKAAPRPAKFWPAMGYATLAGMRSMSAPAFLAAGEFAAANAAKATGSHGL
jgi:hypothetical protein